MRRVVITAMLLACAGCAAGSVERRFRCAEHEFVQWQIPAGWLVRELTPAQARAEIISSNIVKESVDARWTALQNQWRNGDRYWFYRRPEPDTINALGAQEGVVLIRGCEQLGFATTRLATEAERPAVP